ncbi:hypothetical protein BHM03_00004314 [Ensete ventricosum]|nr:hypothetical protein BHM03_00004314 [Ensete ventricosum]
MVLISKNDSRNTHYLSEIKANRWLSGSLRATASSNRSASIIVASPHTTCKPENLSATTSKSHQRREPEKGILDDGDAWKKVCQTKSSGRLERARNRKAILGGASKGTPTRSTGEGDLEQLRISASVHASTDRHRISCRPNRSLLRATGSAANASDDDDEGAALFFIAAVPAMEGFDRPPDAANGFGLVCMPHSLTESPEFDFESSITVVMSTGSKVHFDRLERKIRTNNVTFEHRKCTAAAEAMPWRGHKQLKPAGEMCRASELLTQQCSKKLEKYTNLVDLKAPHVEAQCRVTTGSNKKLKWLIMPAEEHDDAASDDVKPGLLLSQRPAEPSSLRHLPMAPHLHAGQHVDVLIPSSLSALQMERLQLGGFLWQRIEGLYRRRGEGGWGKKGVGGKEVVRHPKLSRWQERAPRPSSAPAATLPGGRTRCAS